MAINLFSKYGNKLAQPYTKESCVKGATSNDYEWDGVKTIKLMTAETVVPGDYNRSASANRFGTPTEMGDTIQELALSQDKSFSIVIDKGNLEDQGGLKQAGAMMKRQDAERNVPMMDKYALEQYALHCGQAIGSATAISKTNVAERVAAAIALMDDAEVDSANRTLWVNSSVYGFIRLSPEFLAADALVDKGVVKGMVGEYQGCKVVKVPAGRMPAGVNFIIAQKDAILLPHKIQTRRILTDVQGIDGSVLEGRDYYDAFVLGARANGVVVDHATGTLVKNATPTQSSGTFACTTAGVTFKYTADGSDPRYSATAKVAVSESEASGTVIKVCAVKAGNIHSDVLTYTA